jgi:hypothetical protein
MAELRGASFKIIGLQELQSQFERVGKMPKKYLNKAAREGIADPLRDAKASAPVGKTGILKKSIKRTMETPNKRNKGVYRIAYDPKYSDVFQKPTTGVYGGKTPYAYYPSSVEYGYKTKFGKTKGQFNLMKAVARHEKSSTQKVVDSLNKSLTQLLKG